MEPWLPARRSATGRRRRGAEGRRTCPQPPPGRPNSARAPDAAGGLTRQGSAKSAVRTSTWPSQRDRGLAGRSRGGHGQLGRPAASDSDCNRDSSSDNSQQRPPSTSWTPHTVPNAVCVGSHREPPLWGSGRTPISQRRTLRLTGGSWLAHGDKAQGAEPGRARRLRLPTLSPTRQLPAKATKNSLFPLRSFSSEQKLMLIYCQVLNQKVTFQVKR